MGRVVALVRYRFFLFAGLLPYLLGAGWAFGQEGTLDLRVFWVGLAGIALAVVGVECFNEYFDSRLGTDRVFDPCDQDPVPGWTLPLGLAAFVGATLVGARLAAERGWPVVAYAGLGGLAAAFYVGPPVRWAYRGLGEAMIALSYGPWMTLGSHWLQTGRWSWPALAASFVPGLLIAALAIANEIPDFYQDRLVGKRNLVVRFGRRAACVLYPSLAALGLALPVVGAAAGFFPKASLATLAGGPFLVASALRARKTCDHPLRFVPAVRAAMLSYLLGAGLFALAVTLG